MEASALTLSIHACTKQEWDVIAWLMQLQLLLDACLLRWYYFDFIAGVSTYIVWDTSALGTICCRAGAFIALHGKTISPKLSAACRTRWRRMSRTRRCRAQTRWLSNAQQHIFMVL
jgi:hypothetical protein